MIFIPVSNGEEQSKETNFSITGDFSNTLAVDFEEATITVTSTGLSEDGDPTQVTLASADLDDAKIVLEGFVDEATIVNISLQLPDE